MRRAVISESRNRMRLASLAVWSITALCCLVDGKLADRSRVVQRRLETGRIDSYHDNGRPIEGPKYRSKIEVDENEPVVEKKSRRTAVRKAAPWKLEQPASHSGRQHDEFPAMPQSPEEFERKLSSQLSGCCYNYQGKSAEALCSIYGNDCESGETPSHDDNDGDCSQDGLSFIGVSFSVNTANGNPYSYQLCDQFPMENIIDRDYNYVMSMDEDGWLVGGGYKTFDYSGKMP